MVDTSADLDFDKYDELSTVQWGWSASEFNDRKLARVM